MGSARRPADVAFKLVHELRGILDGIRADGVVDDSEVTKLGKWLEHNQQFARAAPFDEMAAAVSRALADRVLTIDEVDDLLFVCDNLTTANPHLDRVRDGVQILMGTLAGIAADGRVTRVELDHLTAWLERWGHLKGLWPFDECDAVVTAILSRKELPEDMRAILELAKSFPVVGFAAADLGDVDMLISGVCAVKPDVRFRERTFVFTGESPKAERHELWGHVASRGGAHHENVRKDSNYLVVCEDGSPYWAFACYGRKVEKAVKYRRDGCALVIVNERDFWEAAAGTPITASAVVAPKPPRPTRRKRSYICADCASPIPDGEEACAQCGSVVCYDAPRSSES